MGNVVDNDIIIHVENVTKEYFLGTLDHRSFQENLFHHAKKGKSGETKKRQIMALNGVSFDVHRGEAVGMIGANGAGKSTLLKILSRVTAPTTGRVCLDGTMSSMLEVGTGFHQELTGRENIYINGTILGMTKKEIDQKIEDIINFSECREFIDTPVKRYSSGMYVKLAFSVAAYLDSDIMILDEVLAVGDVKFQNKCLEKIHELSAAEGRTVLCVSHNMSTIQKFCKRCIVLDKGRIIFDGDTQEAIRQYYGDSKETTVYKDYSIIRRFLWLQREDIRLLSAEYCGKEDAVFWDDEPMKMRFRWKFHEDVVKLGMRVEVRDSVEYPVATSLLYNFCDGNVGEEKEITVEINISTLKEGKYKTIYTFFTIDSSDEGVDLDCVDGLDFEKRSVADRKIVWRSKAWGCLELPEMKIVE